LPWAVCAVLATNTVVVEGFVLSAKRAPRDDTVIPERFHEPACLRDEIIPNARNWDVINVVATNLQQKLITFK